MSSLNAMDNAEASIRTVDVVDIHNILTWDRQDFVARSETKVAQRPRYSAKVASGLKIDFEGGVPVPAEQTSRRRFALGIKRAMDIVVGGAALVALAPLLILVAAAIVTTNRGPVLFRQTREGLHGKPFEALKFRSMRVEEGDLTGVAQTTKDDPRVTAVGRFIRRTSIDELPQLINVLRGEMSLVGPRPHVAGMKAAGISYRALVPYYDARLAMPPGLTGWAQANGYRGMTVDAASAIARVDHDIAYVQHFSVWMDIKIIGKTIVGEFVTGSGY